MFIASKYEEIYAPEIKDFIYITDNAYKREQILALECDMLRVLEFNITVPSMYRFLERYSKLADSDDLIFNYSKYLIELTLLEIQMMKWSPSHIACSSIYVANKIMKRSHNWNERMKDLTNYDE